LVKEAVIKYFEGDLSLRRSLEANIAEYKKQYSWDKFSGELIKFCEEI
jgi:glycosyltransferase involved in cell wall biosynthesis